MNTPNFVQEYKAILEVLTKYNEGGAKADSSIMKPAFNGQATIFGVDANGKLVGGPIQGLFDIIDNDFKPSPNAKNAVVRIDIVGTAASARIDTDDISQLSHKIVKEIQINKGSDLISGYTVFAKKTNQNKEIRASGTP